MISVTDQRFVCLIDDEAPVAAVAAKLLEAHGLKVRSYTTAEQFLAEFDDQLVNCVVTDLRMPGIDGIELQRQLLSRGSIVPLIVLTGHADVRTAVRVMEDGALTLIEKPYNPSEFVQAVERAIQHGEARRDELEANRVAYARYQTLCPDEQHILDLMVAGLPNKAIAMKLDISMRTVDRRRRNVLNKMGVDSVSELATMVARISSEDRPRS